MEKITCDGKDYWYDKSNIIDWWDDDVPMIISCVSNDKHYVIYFNENGEVDTIQLDCK